MEHCDYWHFVGRRRAPPFPLRQHNEARPDPPQNPFWLNGTNDRPAHSGLGGMPSRPSDVTAVEQIQDGSCKEKVQRRKAL